MSLRSYRRLAAAVGPLLLLTTAHSVVHGQAAAPAKRPDALDPKAEVPPATHKSALGAYRPAVEVKVGSWRDANDAVTRIGGWRTYAREASPSEGAAAPGPAASAPPADTRAAPATAAASAPAPKPAQPSGGHGHHGKP